AEFRFTVEPFSRSEAVQAALEYLREKDYVRALAILGDAAQRHPEDVEIADVLCVAQATAFEDRLAYEDELETIDVGRVRGVRDLLKDTLDLITRSQKNFGARPASMLAESVVNPSAQNLPSIPQEASLALLSAIQILSERVAKLEQKTKPFGNLLTTL